jgi:hypothetical protein
VYGKPAPIDVYCTGSGLWGASFALVVLLGGAVYVAGGVALGRARQPSSAALAAHPHHGQWVALAGLVRDGRGSCCHYFITLRPALLESLCGCKLPADDNQDDNAALVPKFRCATGWRSPRPAAGGGRRAGRRAGRG